MSEKEKDEPKEKTECLYKIVVVGDSGVGKTSIINRYVHGFFTEVYKSTIGVDFALKEMERNNCNIKIQLWDIAGQERYNSLTHIYYRNAVGVIVVFDLSKKSSFESVEQWKRDIDEKVFLDSSDSDETYPVPTILFANKSDLNISSIDSTTLDEYCKEKKFKKWYKTSAKTNDGIDDAMVYLVDEIGNELKNIKREKDPDVFELKDNQINTTTTIDRPIQKSTKGSGGCEC